MAATPSTGSADAAGAATPASSPNPLASNAAAFGTPTTRPGSRSANRAAKRAAAGTGVRPKTQVRKASRTGPQGNSTGLIVLAAIAVMVVAAVLIVGNPFGAASPSGSPAAAATPIPSHGDGTCPTAAPAPLKAGDVYEVTITTKVGNIVLKVDGALGPNATGNFIALVKCHFYDGIVFHRLVPGFVIQGGDPEGTGGGGPGYTITDDPRTTTYHRGTLAMARTGQPNSQGSQFFIVLADDANSALSDPSVQYPYAIMGEVTSGMDVVDKIAAMQNSGPPSNAAIDPVVMDSVTITKSPTSSTPPTAAPASPTSAPASPSAAPAS